KLTSRTSPIGARLPLVEHVLRHECRGHCRRPAGVESQVGDDLAELLLGQAIVERTPQVTDELLLAAERDQRRANDQAAVALREAGTSPARAQQNPFA